MLICFGGFCRSGNLPAFSFFFFFFYGGGVLFESRNGGFSFITSVVLRRVGV